MLKKIKDFSELVVFEHTIFSSSFILIAMIVAAKGWFGFQVFIYCAIALISARNFAMAFNRYCDIKFDANNPRTARRPSVDGRISKQMMLIFIIINAIIFIVISYFINNLALILSIPFLIILSVYSYFKRFSVLAHFILGVSLGLAPIAGVVAVSGTIPLWSVFLSLGVLFWVAGFDLLYSLQDIDFDKNNNLFSIPSRYGIKSTLLISRISHILACIFWYIFISTSNSGIFSYIGLLCAMLMLIYEHYLVRKDLLNIPKAFFQTNGYLGFVFLIFIIIDNSPLGKAL